MDPLVSIILPTYNGSKYISRSIQSCLDQTYRNIELIIVDDCSTDGTDNIIKDFKLKDERISFIRNAENQKLPMSLNAGFALAKGAYYTWTSDDNYYAANAIEVMLENLNQQEEVGLVYCDYMTVNDADEPTGVVEFGDVNQSMVKWTGCGACFLYKYVIHDQLHGYDPSAFLIEDYDFFLRALLVTRFKYLHRSDLYFYRLHQASLTSLYSHYNFDLQKIVIERRLPALVRIASRGDQILWYRKFAVYYGVGKNNFSRMQYYLVKLAGLSRTHLLITSAYIVFRKFQMAVIAFVLVLISAAKLLFSKSTRPT